MIWLVWRRLRVPLLVALGLVALVVATAVAGRIGWLAAARDLGVEQCFRGASTGACRSEGWFALRADHNGFRYLLALAAVALPGVAGAIVGAALFGPETARGTHVFALSQSLSRVRWWGAGLLIAGLPVAAAVAIVPPVLAWSAAPFAGPYPTSPLSGSAFLTSGPVPVAYVVLAFCVAASGALLLRSTFGALGLAVGLHVAALVVTTVLARPAYLPAETVYVALSAGQESVPWAAPDDALGIAYGYVDAAGREVSPHEIPLVECDRAYSDCLRAAGYTALYSRFQPASRYWPFQAIESGLLLAVATGALGAGLWGLRRRVH